jgi:hypothetical protein
MGKGIDISGGANRGGTQCASVYTMIGTSAGGMDAASCGAGARHGDSRACDECRQVLFKTGELIAKLDSLVDPH